ncbi:MAG: ACP S-malonyltransferase [Myxococcota bacterium]|jgi:[acyl-carrier-protein] S-malonyltransferase|nr:ACP S-malonyltransferase [Myxococcota bacterium]
MPRIAVLFPGQGAQEVGMGRDLIGRDPLLDDLLELASAQVGVDLAKLARSGPARELAMTKALQPLLCALCLGLYRRLESAGLKPLAFAGHSLGELPALAAAGFCDDRTAVELAVLRGRLMEAQANQRSGAMIAVSPMGFEEAQALCGNRPESVLAVAAVNGPTQVTLSGDAGAIDTLVGRLRNRPKQARSPATTNELENAPGAQRECLAKAWSEASRVAAEGHSPSELQVTVLRVSGAWHSEHMREAVEPLRRAVEDAGLREGTFPMVFNRDGRGRTDAAEVPRLLAGQLTSPVRFDLVVAEFMRQGVTDYIEVGPGKVLRGLVRLSCNDPAVRIHNVTDLRAVARCVEEIGA